METENKSIVKRSELFNEILAVVKQIDRVRTVDDAPDHPSVSCELENLFLDKMDSMLDDMDKFFEFANRKCSTDGKGSWKFSSGGAVYFYSTKELYKDWKSGRISSL